MNTEQKTSLHALARVQLDAACAAPNGRAARTIYGGDDHIILRQTLIPLAATPRDTAAQTGSGAEWAIGPGTVSMPPSPL